MKTLWPLALLQCSALLSNAAEKTNYRLKGQIVDDATGQPLAARVAITNSDGTFVDVDGRHEHVMYLGKRWCYVDGTFTFTVPSTGAGVEIRRGLETLPLHTRIEGTGTSLPPRTFRLHRWTDMRRQGYVNGDVHAHLPIPREAHLQMRAEDLNALNLLHMADSEYVLPTNDHFTGRLDTNSSPGNEIYVGQEIRDFQMGHLNLLGATNLVPGYPDMGAGMEYWKTNPRWHLGRGMRGARTQNGMVLWAHVCSLPGAELPVGFALGLVDGIELLTWNDPTEFPNHWNPWLNSGMSQAEFPVMRAVDLYYQLLNCGFRVPIAAGTDKFFEEIPLGSNRTYAKVDEPGGHASWLKAIKAGRTFVSNGPILKFTADDHSPGDVIQFNGKRTVRARVNARSIIPFTMVEIIFNGAIVGHKTIPPAPKAPADGLYAATIEATVDMDRSGWLAARVLDNPDLKNRVLPRQTCVFAHTSPVYFLKEGAKVREQASIEYMQKYVRGTLNWLGTRPAFFNEQDYGEAQQDAEKALQVYQSL